MKVLALAADNGGCEFYRMSEPARIAKSLGVDVTIDYGLNANVSRQYGLTKVNELYIDADVMIIQRPINNVWASAIEQAKRQGITTIVEIDDDYDSIHRDNVAYAPDDPTQPENPYWLRKAASLADHVIVSTPALEKYAPHGRSTVLRNCVPEETLSMSPTLPWEGPVVGWTGTVQTHPNDLQETKGAVGEVMRKNSVPLGIVGDGEHVKRLLRLHWEHSDVTTGWVELENYYRTIINTMNIGIVPLEISPFNQAKSALKGLEMAALGIPFVASPTREYQRLEAYGIGKVASSPGDWRRHLQRLLDRPAERDKHSKLYREIIYNEGMTYEKSAHQWVSVWEQTIEYRKSLHG